jgi:hypothetical protein
VETEYQRIRSPTALKLTAFIVTVEPVDKETSMFKVLVPAFLLMISGTAAASNRCSDLDWKPYTNLFQISENGQLSLTSEGNAKLTMKENGLGREIYQVTRGEGWMIGRLVVFQKDAANRVQRAIFATQQCSAKGALFEFSYVDGKCINKSGDYPAVVDIPRSF